MAFQSTVYLDNPLGVPGEILLDGPTRSAPFTLVSASAAYNIVGATAFTVSSEGVAAAGGAATLPFAGILAQPKRYASYGTSAGGPLAATMTLPNQVVAELINMGQIVVTLPAAAAIGDLVTYNTTTGALATLAPVASFTAAQSTTTLTVSAITAGVLGVGSVVTQASGSISRIVALGTGTGGTGTYIVDTSQTVSSGAATATSVPASGFALVPNATVSRYTVSGAGLGVIRLTN